MTLLTTTLISPFSVTALSEEDWELLIRQARAANLLGRLYYLFSFNKLTQNIEEKYLWHFESAYRLSDRLKKNALREIDELTSALGQINVKPIFLKGAAYQAADLPCSNGRLMSDIDLLVDENVLSQVQSHLRKHSWIPTAIDDYDEKYYREWMHEIPPLKHATRQTTLDVHHNILPLTNKNTIDASRLEFRKVYHEWFGEVQTLNPLDTVIHSSVHLFTESEFDNGLRDLSDLDMLIRHFTSTNKNYVNELVIRANELELADYLSLTLRYTKMVLNTPIAPNAISSLNIRHQSRLSQIFWDFCFKNIFKPHHSSTKNIDMRLAKFILYWRGHLIKMPLRILLPHLAIKSYMQLKDMVTQSNSSKKTV
ncbi:nucleotidyltransferase family protein [Paraglaciecola sp. MB-3u-78]|jgi:hypothetical protein|uniref:nucleotidyltransferase domain-containing protein n=1 Tax=Paraglaciecola sp. MB-3u-78 TaxID=2058332 RepID=UPI000C33E4DA|nr:nucleotidyltransferase family protein [Paraglaciecola sp. MB-3u-78]PKG92979.1 hypothetical protein CXF95_28900 [Paraglaciecola sp. MB-3u-78]